ncbi:restriction endonuclease subunit S [Mannheimia indoligenes]|uniref:Restriction endonuclease subunit S n=1 Tax=Mannheimia indoligenes TaxID=3103145 RepID=A0ABU7ZCQ8_9PAST
MKRYEKYKPSGVEWLGDVPNEWSVTKIKYISELNPKKSNLEKLDQECSFIPMEKLKLGNLLLDETRQISEVYNSYTYFQNGDLLIAKVTPCFENKNFAIANNLVNGIGFGSSEIYVLRSKNCFNRYLFYRLQENTFMDLAAGSMIGAGGLKRIPSDFLNNYVIALPPNEEQVSIANFLDKKTEKIDRLISHQQALLEKLSEKRTALITETVCGRVRLPTAPNDNETLSGSNAPLRNSGIEWLGEVPEHWLITRLKYVGEIVLGLTYSPEDITNDENAILVLRSSNVQNGKLLLNDNVYVNKDIPKKMQTTENDILICSRNGSRALIGKCTVIEGDAIGQTFGAFMTVFRSPYKRFIYYVLSSELFKSQLGNYLTSTINQLTTQVLGNFEIAFPPESEQTTIVNYLDTETAKIDRLQHKIERVIERLKEYRSALITQVVTGKVKV